MAFVCSFKPSVLRQDSRAEPRAGHQVASQLWSTDAIDNRAVCLVTCHPGPTAKICQLRLWLPATTATPWLDQKQSGKLWIWYDGCLDAPVGPTRVQFGTDCLQRTRILRNHGFTVESWSSKFASMSMSEVEFCWDSDRLGWVYNFVSRWIDFPLFINGSLNSML